MSEKKMFQAHGNRLILPNVTVHLGRRDLSILYLEVPLVKYGGSPLHLSPCPEHPGSARQRGGPALAPSTPWAHPINAKQCETTH